MRKTCYIAAYLVGIVVAAGCSPEVDRSSSSQLGADDDPATGSFPYVQIRAAHEWHEQEPASLEFWAVFVRYTGTEREDVERQLGTLSPELPAPGACVLRPEHAAPGDVEDVLGEGEVTVDLLDAGGLFFNLPGQTLVLEPTPYPDLLPNVSGMQYRRVTFGPLTSTDIGSLGLVGVGGDQVPPFELQEVKGPDDFRLLSVGGGAPDSGPHVARRSEPLRIVWRDYQPQFERLVTLSWTSAVGRHLGELVCRPRAPGHLVVPVGWLSRIPLRRGSAEVTLTVELRGRSELRIKGFEPGVCLTRRTDTVQLLLIR